jgi:hypothetical protein
MSKTATALSALLPMVTAAFTVLASPANAVSVAYTTDTATFTNLGGATPGDTLTLGNASGVFTGAGIYTVNNVSFNVTRFAVTPMPFTGTFTDTATSSFGQSPYSVDYSLQLGALDTITLGGNVFDFGGYHFVINPLALTAGVNQTVTGVLTATVTGGVPEPTAWVMMIAGFGLVGSTLRRRSSGPINVAA